MKNLFFMIWLVMASQSVYAVGELGALHEVYAYRSSPIGNVIMVVLFFVGFVIYVTYRGRKDD